MPGHAASAPQLPPGSLITSQSKRGERAWPAGGRSPRFRPGERSRCVLPWGRVRRRRPCLRGAGQPSAAAPPKRGAPAPRPPGHAPHARPAPRAEAATRRRHASRAHARALRETPCHTFARSPHVVTCAVSCSVFRGAGMSDFLHQKRRAASLSRVLPRKRRAALGGLRPPLLLRTCGMAPPLHPCRRNVYGPLVGLSWYRFRKQRLRKCHQHLRKV